MQAFVLFLVRVVTGFTLIVFSISKVLDTPAAIEVSDKLYMGYASTPVAQHGLAALGAVLGVFVILGFLKTFSYGVQFIVLLVGAVALARVNVVLPVELVSGVASATLLLPSVALVLLALSLIVWIKDDFFALDGFINFRKNDLAQDAAHAAALSAPVAAVAAHAEHAHAEPAHEEPAHAEPAHAEPVHHDDHGHEAHGEEPHAAHAEPAHAEPAHDDHGHDAHGHDAHGQDGHGHDDHADHGHHAEPAHDDHAKAHHAH